MTYRVAICDDDEMDFSYVKACLCRWASSHKTDVVVDVFPSAESFLFRREGSGGYDILLLDIEMGLMDGVELALRVRANDKAVQIVFITGYRNYS